MCKTFASSACPEIFSRGGGGGGFEQKDIQVYSSHARSQQSQVQCTSYCEDSREVVADQICHQRRNQTLRLHDQMIGWCRSKPAGLVDGELPAIVVSQKMK